MLLEPNPHNRQPWLAELAGEDTVHLRMDPARRLPHTDPFDRQLVIGMGCFVELMVQAAGAEGLAVELQVSARTGPNETPEITARFGPGGAPDTCHRLHPATTGANSCERPMRWLWANCPRGRTGR